MNVGIKTKARLLLMELKSDERLTYEPATVFVNAPLALIQHGLLSQINILEKLLDLPLSKIPILSHSNADAEREERIAADMESRLNYDRF